MCVCVGVRGSYVLHVCVMVLFFVGNCTATDTSLPVSIVSQPGVQISMLCFNTSETSNSAFVVFLSSEDRDVVLVNDASVVGKLRSACMARVQWLPVQVYKGLMATISSPYNYCFAVMLAHVNLEPL